MNTPKLLPTSTKFLLRAALALPLAACAAGPSPGYRAATGPAATPSGYAQQSLPESLRPRAWSPPLPEEPVQPPTAHAERAAVLLSYGSLRSSEFYQFFRLREVASTDLAGGGRMVELKPGAFERSIDIALDLDAEGNVRTAHLGLARSWVGGMESVNPLAADLAASFLSTFAGDRDSSRMKDFADALRTVHATPDRGVEFQTATASPQAIRFVRTFVGADSTFATRMHDLEFAAKNQNASVRLLHLELKARGAGEDRVGVNAAL